MVFEFLYEKKTTVYVCGKVAMADAVNNAIIEVIDKHLPESVRNETSAVDYVNMMKQNGRYNQDIFGQ